MLPTEEAGSKTKLGLSTTMKKVLWEMETALPFIISTDCPVKLLVQFQILRDNDINFISSLSFLLEMYKL